MDFIRHAKVSALQHASTQSPPQPTQSPVSRALVVLCMCSSAASEASSGTFQMQSDQFCLFVAGFPGDYELGV